MRQLGLYITLFIVLCGILIRFFSFPYWETSHHVRGDGLAYYSYLPGNIIHNDLRNTFYPELDEDEKPNYWLYEGTDGAYLPKMTMGVALIWLPGYLVAHSIAAITDYEQSGWSAPYKTSIAITGILTLLIGCLFCYKVLRRRFSSFVSGLTVLLLVFATNLFHYAASEMSMSHVYTFALVAAFIDACDRWLTGNRWYHWALMGLLLGWITLIRPTNLIVGLIPLTMLFNSRHSLNRLLSRDVLIGLFSFMLPLIPQLLFWKSTTDEWVYYSYSNESFYWFKSEILKGLFSYRNGWLLYIPIFIFAIAGLVYARRIDRGWALGASLVLLIHVYITFAWWCWYYGDSLSIRPMIDIYPVISIGLAGFLAWVFQNKPWVRGIALVFLILFTYNNHLQVKHYNTTTLTGSTMTKAAFWALFLEPEAPTHLSATRTYRDVDVERLRQGLPERTTYDTTLLADIANIQLDPVEIIETSGAFTEAIKLTDTNLLTRPNEWIRLNYLVNLENRDQSLATVVFSFNNGDENISYQAVELDDMEVNEGEEDVLTFYLRSPRNISDTTVFETYLWNQGEGRTQLNGLKIEKVRIDYSEPQ